MSLFKDQVSHQAKAVLNYLNSYDGIETSWSTEDKRYRACPTIAEWHNGREHGYVISLYTQAGKQFNVAFFEHRNSDEICAVHWYQDTGMNPPNLATANFGDKYQDKYDLDIVVPYGEAGEMASMIYNLLETHWLKNDQ